jgi:hypothetical protein
MNNDEILKEILPTPSQELRQTKEDEAAPCSGVCGSGMCQTQ